MNDRGFRSIREGHAPDLWPEIERRLREGVADSVPVGRERRTRWAGPALVVSIVVSFALVSSGIWALTKMGGSPGGHAGQPFHRVLPGSITRIPLDPRFGPPQAIAAGEGAAWVVVGTSEANVVYRVDDRSGEASLLPDTRGARWVAAGEGAAWVTACPQSDKGRCNDPVVLRLSPQSGAIVARIPLGSDPGQVSTGDGAVWVATGGTLVRIDPKTNSISDTFPVCCSLWGASQGSVWMADLNGRLLLRVDARTGRVLARFDAPRRDPCQVAVGEGYVWIASCLSPFAPLPGGNQPDLIQQIDPSTNKVVDTRSIEPAVHMAAGAGFLWLARAPNDDTGITLTRVDPGTHEPVGQPVRLLPDSGRKHFGSIGFMAGPPLFLAVTADVVWISDFEDAQVIRIQLPLPAGPPTCGFAIGDTINRAGGGVVVPPLGKGVIGNFDGVTSSGFISISTSPDGIVTIKSKVTGQPEKIEICKLP